MQRCRKVFGHARLELVEETSELKLLDAANVVVVALKMDEGRLLDEFEAAADGISVCEDTEDDTIELIETDDEKLDK